MDSLHSESHHPLAAQERAHGLSGLQQKLSTPIQFLSELRRAAGGYDHLGSELLAAVGVNEMPYFFKMG